MQRRSLFAFLLATVVTAGAAAHARGGMTPQTQLAGVAWETSFATAQQKARQSGKPVLLLQLFGRLDEEFC